MVAGGEGKKALFVFLGDDTILGDGQVKHSP